MAAPPVDITVVGGGLVGLATARALLESEVTDAVRVLEKEDAPGRHQSTHNSGVLHAGLAYAPGSAKARLARDGIRRMVEYCRARGIAHDICGKLVVAVRPDEVPRLEALHERGRSNGLTGLRLLTPEQAREIEPHAGGLAALHVPEEGIVSFAGVVGALVEDIAAAGGIVESGNGLRGASREGSLWRLDTDLGERASRVVVNCAGLHADRVARLCGVRPTVRILPFRGEYRKLRVERASLVRHLVYPVARPGFPFLGVHFTRRVDGTIDAGPTAVLAFAREGYRVTDVDVGDLAQAVSSAGLWRFVARHPGVVAEELARSVTGWGFFEALRGMIPELRRGDLEPGGSGVRAQAVRADGTLVDDFLWIERPGAVHVLNAASPAATASLAIGRVVAARAARALRELTR